MSIDSKRAGRDWKAFWKSLGWTDADDDDDLTWRLRQRAEQYASAPDDSRHDDDSTTTLAFDLGSERYAVDVTLVRAVRKVDTVTPIPGIPDFYRGVVNVRGQIVTVMDLRPFYGMTIDTRAVPPELVVVQANELEIGLLADHVSGLRTVSTGELSPVEDLRYARGITPEQLILLDVARLFEDKRLIIGSKDE